MSNYISSFLNRTSSKAKKNKFDLSSTVVTTQDFFVNKPVYIKELMPNEKISIDVDYFSRMSPIQEPFLGKARNVMRAFFVPMRTIMYDWNEFITQTENNSGTTSYVPSVVPSVSMKFFHDLFVPYDNNTFSTLGRLVVPADQRPSHYQTPDFYSYYRMGFSDSSARVGFCFTSKGRFFYDILVNLGYRIDFDVPYTDWNSGTYWTYVSLLPLFAFCKIFKDWFANSAYSTYVDLDLYTKSRFVRANFTVEEFYNLLDQSYRIMYKSDYFTSAWDNPVSPNNSSLEGSFREMDITNNNSYGVNSVITNSGPNPDTPTVYTGTSTQITQTQTNYLTQYVVDFLKRITDYVKRHQLAGSRVLDRYKAQFGIDLAPAKLDRSIYLGKHLSEMVISDVMQTAPDTSEGTSDSYGVGNYAGRGLIVNNKNGHFEYETDEFGYLIITSCVIPKILYGDGQSKTVMRINPFDFYTGDFDNLGVQAISLQELSAGFMTDNGYPDSKERVSVFGYSPRYADYKVGVHQDNVSGDFILPSRNASLEGWVLRRRYSVADIETFDLPTVHNKEFTLGDGSLYNYVFQENTVYADHFFSLFDFKVTSYMPCKPLYELYDFDVNNGGQETIQQVNGTNVSNM